MLWGVILLAILFLFFPKYVGFLLARREAESETTATNPLVTKTTIAIPAPRRIAVCGQKSTGKKLGSKASIGSRAAKVRL